MNFPDQNTTGNINSRGNMNPSRNRELEVAQAGLRRSYEQDHTVDERTDSKPLQKLFLTVLMFFSIFRN